MDKTGKLPVSLVRQVDKDIYDESLSESEESEGVGEDCGDSQGVSEDCRDSQGVSEDGGDSEGVSEDSEDVDRHENSENMDIVTRDFAKMRFVNELDPFDKGELFYSRYPHPFGDHEESLTYSQIQDRINQDSEAFNTTAWDHWQGYEIVDVHRKKLLGVPSQIFYEVYHDLKTNCTNADANNRIALFKDLISPQLNCDELNGVVHMPMGTDVCEPMCIWVVQNEYSLSPHLYLCFFVDQGVTFLNIQLSSALEDKKVALISSKERTDLFQILQHGQVLPIDPLH